jgi:hypothetical protein
MSLMGVHVSFFVCVGEQAWGRSGGAWWSGDDLMCGFDVWCSFLRVLHVILKRWWPECLSIVP